MDMLAGETEIRDYALERLMMLSDGVFAIAMTLLALELRPPERWNGTLDALLTSMMPDLQAFFWSFFSAAMFWTVHRRMFGNYRRADGSLTAINLVLLGEITLIPVVTRIYVLGFSTRLALHLYLGLFAVIGLTNTASWSYAAFAGKLVRADIGPRTRAVVAVTNAILPISMTTLGVLAARPGYGWTPLLIPAVILIFSWLRRAAIRHDHTAPHAA